MQYIQWKEELKPKYWLFQDDFDKTAATKRDERVFREFRDEFLKNRLSKSKSSDAMDKICDDRKKYLGRKYCTLCFWDNNEASKTCFHCNGPLQRYRFQIDSIIDDE